MELIYKLIKSKNHHFRKSSTTTFVNPFSYLRLRQEERLVGQLDQILIDGFLLIIILRTFGVRIKRYSMDTTSLFPTVIDFSIKNNLEVYFIGASSTENAKFIRILKRGYPLLKIQGYRNGYFYNDIEKQNFISNLVNQNPDIVICGMGTPLQEKFLVDLKSKGWEGIGYTCGGFIHQTSKGLNYYPTFFNKLGLRWFYRIIDEPKLFYRYFIIYPKAILIFLIDLVKFKYFR